MAAAADDQGLASSLGHEFHPGGFSPSSWLVEVCELARRILADETGKITIGTEAAAPKRDGKRVPKGMRLLTGAAFCGNCGSRLHVTGGGNFRYAYERTAQIRGIRALHQ